jgi:anti-sigma-K factor RskA
MNIRDNAGLRDRLAAEYALGTLRGGARHRFETWLRDDRLLRAAVADWQGRLATLAELQPPVTPPARVWDGIERRLALAPQAAQAPWWQFWKTSAARPWGVLALAASAGALVLAVRLAGPPVSAPQAQQIAALSDAQSQTVMVITADTRHQRLQVRVAQDVHVPADRTLQLWAITRAGKPRSLGILPDNRSTDLALDARAIAPDVALLAISLEPKGGSPDPNGPTGPVLYKGGWARL